VKQIEDLDGAGDELGGQIPDPRRAVPQDGPTLGLVEAAPPRLAVDALCEIGKALIGVTGGRALDGRRVADRSLVTYRDALFVAFLGGPDGHELDLARLCRAVFLLSLAPFQLRGAHGHTRAVHSEVHRRRRGRRRLDHGPFVLGYLAPQRFGGPFDGLGRHVDAGQLPQELVALREADHRGHPPVHARHCRRKRRARKPEGQVPWTEAGRAEVAVVVGT
jgi:hypothetical protein